MYLTSCPARFSAFVILVSFRDDYQKDSRKPSASFPPRSPFRCPFGLRVFEPSVCIENSLDAGTSHALRRHLRVSHVSKPPTIRVLSRPEATFVSASHKRNDPSAFLRSANPFYRSRFRERLEDLASPSKSVVPQGLVTLSTTFARIS